MSLILAHVRNTLLDMCSFHFMQLSFHLLAKRPDVNLLLGILRAVSSCHVAECVQRTHHPCQNQEALEDVCCCLDL